MNKKLVVSLLGKLLLMEAAFMLPSVFVAIGYGEGDAPAFLWTIALLLAVGLPCAFLPRPHSVTLYAREGFVVAGLAWVLLSLFGCLPFLFNGDMTNFADAFFECVSGFTTTGATVLSDVEALPNGLLFWRSFTHWIGGMGVLVLTLALLPKMSGRVAHLARAESPGPVFSKLLPKMGDTAKLLYFIYTVMTLLQTALLALAGMPLFDALLHAFGTAGTGGFSTKNLSVGAYDSMWIDVIITVFMFLFGINFAVYFRLLLRDVRGALRNTELIVYIAIALLSMTLIALTLLPAYGGFFPALRYSSFQVGSIMSTTGYATANFDLWPQFSRMLLVLLMVIGSCAGSTAGGVKVVRVVLLCKMVARELRHTFQPRKVQVVKMDGKSVNEETLSQIGLFFFLYAALLALGTLAVSLEGVDATTSFTSAVACLSNIGPGLSLVGPMGNFGMMSSPVKIVLSFLMLAGRLEFFPLLVLFHPAVWRRS